jgi:hypothetical protein
MTEVNDFDRYALLAQSHRHGRENECRRRVAGQVRLFQFRPAVESHRIENAFPVQLFVDEIGHRTGEMARHRQKSDSEFVLTPGRLLRAKDVQINGSVNERDKRQSRHGDGDENLAERHFNSRSIEARRSASTIL